MKEKSLIKKLRAAANALEEVFALLNGAETPATAALVRKTFKVKRSKSQAPHWTKRPENAKKAERWKKKLLRVNAARHKAVA